MVQGPEDSRCNNAEDPQEGDQESLHLPQRFSHLGSLDDLHKHLWTGDQETNRHQNYWNGDVDKQMRPEIDNPRGT